MLILREPHENLQITRGPDAWKELLEHPPRRWHNSRATRRLAEAWEAAAPRAPEALSDAFAGSPFTALLPVLAIPAYEVRIPGAGRVQSDLMVLGFIREEFALLLVEGQIAKALGPTLRDWLQNPTPGKLRCIGFMKEVLHLADPLRDSMCCGLMQHATAAVVEAHRLHARYGAMVVSAFGSEEASIERYRDFASACGVSGEPGKLERVPHHEAPELWLAWIDDPPPEA